MPSSLFTLLEKIAVPLIVAIIGALVTFLVARLGRKGDRENAHIDQLQEDRTADREQIKLLTDEMAEQRKEIAELQQKFNRLLSRDTQWEIHSSRVEAQVTLLGGTPHPRPADLTTP